MHACVSVSVCAYMCESVYVSSPYVFMFSCFVCVCRWEQVLQQQPHKLFKRKGHDLCMLRQATLRQVRTFHPHVHTPPIFLYPSPPSQSSPLQSKAISGFNFVLNKMDGNSALIQCPPRANGGMVCSTEAHAHTCVA